MEEIEANEPIKPLEGNMLFYLERTGGIAGLRMTVMLNTEGHTKLTAAGDPVCRKEEPPCEKPSRQFTIKVVVTNKKTLGLKYGYSTTPIYL